MSCCGGLKETSKRSNCINDFQVLKILKTCEEKQLNQLHSLYDLKRRYVSQFSQFRSSDASSCPALLRSVASSVASHLSLSRAIQHLQTSFLSIPSHFISFDLHFDALLKSLETTLPLSQHLVRLTDAPVRAGPRPCRASTRSGPQKSCLNSSFVALKRMLCPISETKSSTGILRKPSEWLSFA